MIAGYSQVKKYKLRVIQGPHTANARVTHTHSQRCTRAVPYLCIKFLSVWLFYCFISCFTVNNVTMQYTHNVLFNTQHYVADLILTVGVNHR